MNTQLIPLVIPNTDVVIITEKRHVVKIGGTKELPLIWIKGISRAFQLANSRTLPANRNSGAMLKDTEREISPDPADSNADGGSDRAPSGEA